MENLNLSQFEQEEIWYDDIHEYYNNVSRKIKITYITNPNTWSPSVDSRPRARDIKLFHETLKKYVQDHNLHCRIKKGRIPSYYLPFH